MVTYRVEQQVAQGQWNPIEVCIKRVLDAAYLATKAGRVGYHVRIVREADSKTLIDASADQSEYLMEWYAQLEGLRSVF